MKISMEEATATQLAEFAVITFGLDVNLRMGKEALRARLEQVGFTGDTIDVPDPVQPTAARPADASASPRKMVTIIIQNQPGPGGKDHVPVGVNGRFYRIKRGVPVDVPVEVEHVLRNANIVQFEHGPNGEPINPSEVPTHPYSIVQAA